MKKTVLLMAAMMTAASVQAAEAKGKGHRFGPKVSFDQLDADSNGEITQAEFEAFRAAKFAEADTNGDGGLSAEELSARAGDERKERATKRAERMIEKLDANDDGLLQPDEMSGQRETTMMDRIDTDDNGSVSKEEFEAAQEKRKGKGKGKGKKDDKSKKSE